MKKQTRLISLPAILMAAVASVLVTDVSIQAMGSDLIWTIVTSEADSGPGTLRQAIMDVNGGGTDSPNAIAFAKNVKTIQLQTLLPTVEEPVLIDGLAKVNNGTVVQEGNCDSLPSPVDDPCGFSCGLNVTIDGSMIPAMESPDERYGLNLEAAADGTVVRGLCITNITTPGLNSIALGIINNSSNSRIECCEIKEIRNTAGTTFDGDPGIVIGIYSFDKLIIDKTYIHSIQGGTITIGCNDTLGSNTEFVSGLAFGISTEGHITNTRVEQIESGSIITCQPTGTSEDGLTLIISAAIGITNEIDDFLIPTNIRSHKGPKQDCPLASTSCSDCNLCPSTSSEALLSVENSLITNIIGGSLTSNIAHSMVTQNYVAGIAIGNLIPIAFVLSLSESTISNVQTGSASLSGDNSELLRFGSRGVMTLGGMACIRCNIITNIVLNTLQLSGFNVTGITGFSHGIALGIATDAFVECNEISNINGGHAVADGNCSKLLPSASIVENIFLSRIKKPKKKLHTKYIPSGTVCNPALPFSVTGMYIPACNTIQVSKNTVSNISGIKHTLRSEGTEALTIGSAGITVGNQAADESTIDNNSVNSVVGPELVAFAGSGKIQNLQGSAGIDANGFNIEVTNNCVNNIREGKVRLQHNSLVAHFTDSNSFNLLKRFRSVRSLYRNTPFVSNAESFVPVVTVGIAASGRERKGGPIGEEYKGESRGIQTSHIITINDNTVSNIAGAIVPGGQLPLGSVAAGIVAQPAIEQYLDIPFGTADSGSNIPAPLLTECNNAEELLGVISNNNVSSVTAGTKNPGYGILLDGSQLFLSLSNLGTNTDQLSLGLFEINNNTIKTLKGNGSAQPFMLTLEQLSSLHSCCLEVNGTDGTECDFTTNFIPLLPFEPTSGIYTLFGNCSTLNDNTITNVRDSIANARGITTAASSDMNIFDNTLSQITGYGIFVGGSVVDNTIATGTEFLVDELLPSVRNKIYNNSTVNNTNKGIELGLIDWNYFVFARNTLNACKSRLTQLHQEELDDSTVIYGNHGQVAPCIKKVTCNSNGTVTIDVNLNNTLQLTNFVIQFFRNSSNSVPHGEQHISQFHDPQFVLQTDINGNAHGRFTFLPLAKIKSEDIISAHVTVQDPAIMREEFLGDTSEFSSEQQQSACPISGLQRPHQSSKPGFMCLVSRTPEQDHVQEATA